MHHIFVNPCQYESSFFGVTPGASTTVFYSLIQPNEKIPHEPALEMRSKSRTKPNQKSPDWAISGEPLPDKRGHAGGHQAGPSGSPSPCSRLAVGHRGGRYPQPGQQTGKQSLRVWARSAPVRTEGLFSEYFRWLLTTHQITRYFFLTKSAVVQSNRASALGSSCRQDQFPPTS